MKYYATSDLHGINPQIFLNELIKTGFVFNNENFKLVVAGDIIDSHGYDNELIQLLRKIENNNQLIVIKGNHDHYEYMRNWAKLTKDNEEWLVNLPFQLETEHFYLAHGMYIPDGKMRGTKEQRAASLWASPILLHMPPDKWNLSFSRIKYIKNTFYNINFYDAMFNKPVLLGHFMYDTNVIYYDYYAPDIKYNIDENNFITVGNNIHYLDTGIKITNKPVFKIFEF